MFSNAFGFGRPKTVDRITASLTDMVNELQEHADKNWLKAANLRVDAAEAQGEADRANSIANKLGKLLA